MQWYSLVKENIASRQVDNSDTDLVLLSKKWNFPAYWIHSMSNCLHYV